MIGTNSCMWKGSDFAKFGFAKSLSQPTKKLLHTPWHVDFFLVPPPLWNGKFFFQAHYQSLNKHEGLGCKRVQLKSLDSRSLPQCYFRSGACILWSWAEFMGPGRACGRTRWAAAHQAQRGSHLVLAGAGVTHAVDSGNCWFRPWLQN